MKWLYALSVPKVITVLCLLGLGVNGLVQVGLQKDMARKAQSLQAQLAQTQQLSGQMKNGLNGLSDLRVASTHMANTLTQLQTTTAEMNQGLAQLGATVNGIGGTIHTLGTSTQAADAQVQAAEQAAKSLQDILQQINGVNGDVIQNLNQMIDDQKAINANLEDMNRKTQMLPQLGGNG